MDGTIKWFNASRRYGFIEPADGGGDIVFDDRALAPELRDAPLKPGDAVAFEVVDGPRGPEASSVSRIVGSGAPAAL